MSIHETGGRPADQPPKDDQPAKTETPASRVTPSTAEDQSNRESRGTDLCPAPRDELDRVVAEWQRAEDASNRESREHGVNFGPNIRSYNAPVKELKQPTSEKEFEKKVEQSEKGFQEKAAQQWEEKLKVVLKK